MFSLSSNHTIVAFVPGDDASDPVTDLPTYAMQRLNPYPFGIDPVSEYVVINWLFVLAIVHILGYRVYFGIFIRVLERRAIL